MHRSCRDDLVAHQPDRRGLPDTHAHWQGGGSIGPGIVSIIAASDERKRHTEKSPTTLAQRHVLPWPCWMPHRGQGTGLKRMRVPVEITPLLQEYCVATLPVVSCTPIVAEEPLAFGSPVMVPKSTSMTSLPS